MSDHSILTTYYNTRSSWGERPDDANLRRIERTLGLIPTGVRSILDVGCGDGRVSNRLVANGREVVGLDISEVALGGSAGMG
jgi:2-polyprenyl-3-methyl-5-hydroxy-6-metoxy-1,4-benzoquinol methylase